MTAIPFLYYYRTRPDCYDGSTPSSVLVAWLLSVVAAAILSFGTMVVALPRTLATLLRYSLALIAAALVCAAVVVAIRAAWPGFC